MTTEDAKVRLGSKVIRPWGYYRLIVHKKGYSVKLLYINPGEETSLQRHSKRNELITLLDGTVTITQGQRTFSKDHSNRAAIHRVLAGEWHRFAAPNDQKGRTILLEVAYGELDPDDFQRKTDKYNRARTQGPGYVDKLMHDSDWRKITG